jgi:hypothetical protein
MLIGSSRGRIPGKGRTRGDQDYDGEGDDRLNAERCAAPQSQGGKQI